MQLCSDGVLLYYAEGEKNSNYNCHGDMVTWMVTAMIISYMNSYVELYFIWLITLEKIANRDNSKTVITGK